jgi:hypothetical protein
LVGIPGHGKLGGLCGRGHVNQSVGRNCDAAPVVIQFAAEESGVDGCRGGSVDHGEKRVLPAPESGLVSVGGNREITGQRGADHINVAGLIDVDGVAVSVALSSTEKRGVEQRNLPIERRVQHRYKPFDQIAAVGGQDGIANHGKAGRSGGAGKIDVSLRIQDHRQGHIGAVATQVAEISRPESARHAGIENGHKDIGPAHVDVGVCAVDVRQVAVVGGPGDIQQPVSSEPDNRDLVIGASTHVRRVNQDRVDHQRLAAIIGAHAEGGHVARKQHVAAGDGCITLTHNRTLLRQHGSARLHFQIALRRDPETVGSAEPHADGTWVGPGRHHQVILQTSLVAVINRVDAPIHLRVAHPRVAGDAGMPMGAVADEVVGAGGKRLQRFDARRGGAFEEHVHASGPGQAQRRAAIGEGHLDAAAARQIPHGRIPLTLVHFKPQRKRVQRSPARRQRRYGRRGANGASRQTQDPKHT